MTSRFDYLCNIFSTMIYRRGAFGHLILVLFVLLLLQEVKLTHGALKQLVVVHRHGARKELIKHAIDPGEESVNNDLDVLYPEGEQQLQRLGEFIRDNAGLADVKPTDVVAYSSNTRRTMLSSRAFLNGLLKEDSEKVATMMFESLDEDWLIRGYALCDRLADKFRDFTATEMYNEREKEDGNFVIDMAKKLKMEEKFHHFDQVFNVYDKYVIQSYVTSDEKIALTADEGKRLTEIADWYESSKFHFATHEIHVAGGLFRDIMTRMQNFTGDSEAKDENQARIVEYSAHYPTILTLLATLRSESENGGPTFPADKIPAFGGALLLQLEETGDGSKSVRMKWYPGGDDSENDIKSEDINKDVSFGLDSCPKDSPVCPLDSLLDGIDRFVLQQFCSDCHTEDKPCNNENTCSSNHRAFTASIAAIVGVIVGLVGALFYVSYAEKKKHANEIYRTASGDCGGSDITP